MDFDLNEEIGSDIFTEDVEAVIENLKPVNAAVEEGVQNRASIGWDLNLDASSYVLKTVDVKIGCGWKHCCFSFKRLFIVL